ncbi:hypothetical protein [Gemmobacter serpentinus]|uniref:hypothetical protein n=1 Tax=Gemmobacter serpentinus TaxID=2652247 RepID=UPI0018657DFA|nr:hypothetical protein [Gemmobacter serpentinus]
MPEVTWWSKRANPPGRGIGRMVGKGLIEAGQDAFGQSAGLCSGLGWQFKDWQHKGGIAASHLLIQQKKQDKQDDETAERDLPEKLVWHRHPLADHGLACPWSGLPWPPDMAGIGQFCDRCRARRLSG